MPFGWRLSPWIMQRHASRARTIGLVSLAALGLAQARPAHAQAYVFYCQNYRVVLRSEALQPPVRIRDSILSIYPDQMQWTISFVQEDGNPTREIARRIQSIDDDEVILYQSNMGGQPIEEKFQTGTLTYLDTEYSLYGKVRNHTQGNCVQSQ